MSNHSDSIESMDDIDMDLLCDELENLTEMVDVEDVPSALIITNIDISVFEDTVAQVGLQLII